MILFYRSVRSLFEVVLSSHFSRICQVLTSLATFLFLLGLSTAISPAQAGGPDPLSPETRRYQMSDIPEGLTGTEWQQIINLMERYAHKQADMGEGELEVTANPAQQAYLKASNTEWEDEFGYSVSVSGNTVVVGAIGESSNAKGVNGNQVNNLGYEAGAAYVFVRNGATWSQQAYLKASNTGQYDRFGWSTAISGDTIVVGALYEDSNATQINGNQTNNLAENAGAAYVFVRNGTTWSQQAYLKASNAEEYDHFGVTVAVSGDTIIIGARGEDSGATGVNGNQASNSINASGAAYVFVRNGTTWSQQGYLKASNTGEDDLFGSAVAISGDTIVVGALDEDSRAKGVNGNQTDNFSPDAGAAYVFVRDGTAWSQQAYLKASNTNSDDWFGAAVAVAGNTILIGAPREESSATGVNGDQSDNSNPTAGAVYVFERQGKIWSQQAYLKASNSGSSDSFGWSVAIAGNAAVIGASYEDSAATGINGDQTDSSAFGAGAAYVFERHEEVWSQSIYLKASNTGIQDEFGSTVSISGDTIVIGAPFEASNATGINGDQADDSALWAGAAYIFVVPVPPWETSVFLPFLPRSLAD